MPTGRRMSLVLLLGRTKKGVSVTDAPSGVQGLKIDGGGSQREPKPPGRGVKLYSNNSAINGIAILFTRLPCFPSLIEIHIKPAA